MQREAEAQVQANARVVTDRRLLLDLMLTDRVTCVYMLGDLEEHYSDECTWYGAGSEDALDAVLLVYNGLSIPVIITFGQSGAVQDIVATFARDLPGRTLVQFAPHHIAAFDSVFGTEGLVPTLRMGLEAADYRPAVSTAWEIEPLTHRHTVEIVELYQTYYPDNFFEPAQLQSGHYCGIRCDGTLASVAGVHVFGPTTKVAVLGNIVTHPEYRGRGMSTACTSHICGRLIEEGIEVLALNVRRRNRAAVRVYERLGFRYHDTFLEGLIVKANEPSA